ncbi:MAG: aldose 1-epimerase family protein [Candidatus Avoscillospira sp.]
MGYSAYLGHPSQLCSVEEVRLQGGRGDGMRLLQIRNGSGLELTVSVDRCADISRLIFKGDNMGYFSPCGYVAPGYYDDRGDGFLKSFTAGFLTTCGLTAVGSPCVDEGETLPLHGTIGNTPCDRIWWEEAEDRITVHAEVSDRRIFARKLFLRRTLAVGTTENTVTLTDTVENQGDTDSPLMLMYHMNLGYPLLSEHAVVRINSRTVVPRDRHAAKDLDTWQTMLPPTPGFAEQCYYHRFEGQGQASVYNPDIGKKLEISFDSGSLWNLTEWKMMGVHDYVLGLEPGNCTPDGREAMRRTGMLQILKAGETASFTVKIRLFTCAGVSTGDSLTIPK